MAFAPCEDLIKLPIFKEKCPDNGADERVTKREMPQGGWPWVVLDGRETLLIVRTPQFRSPFRLYITVRYYS